MLGSNQRHFTDQEFLNKCKALAISSPCQKLGFGAVIYHLKERRIVSMDYNRPITPLKSVCRRRCVRLDIPSRTQSMLGSCSHAEEIAMRWAHWRQEDLTECIIFIAGWTWDADDGDGQLLELDKDYSCIRCAVAMYNAGLRKVLWWTKDGWHGEETNNCVRQAYGYAEGRKIPNV